MPETEARPRVKNRHGGAPRGERPTPRDARRLANAWCRVISALTRVHRPSKTGVNALNDALGTPRGYSAEHPNVSRRSARPSIRGWRSKGANPGREKRAAGA